MIERDILIKVEDDGEILVLLDGRKLRVAPKDLPISSKWLLMSELEMSDDSDNPLYDITVRNLVQNEEVRAMWV
ncbi:MAG: hypothetical protein JXA50_00455 [Deltaproteobacteria bacterium]|nr:hypothetical protein [Deltaproteobacteria bacterium]